MNYIPISSIAKFIGKCKYSSFEKEFINVLQSYHLHIWDDMIINYLEEINIYQPNVKLIKDRFSELEVDDSLSATQNFEILCKRKRVRKFLADKGVEQVDIDTSTVKTEQDVEADVKEIISNDIQEFITDQTYDETVIEEVAQKNDLDIEIVKSVAIKERGTTLENNTIEYLKQTTKYNNYIEQKRVRKDFNFSKNKNKYSISGKIDLVGLNDDDIRCVYEIKNRKSSYLHMNPPEYDYIQLYCYIYLVGKKGKIVSQCDGDVMIHETISKKEAVYEFENNIKPLLDEHMEKANKIIENKYSKETFELISEFLN